MVLRFSAGWRALRKAGFWDMPLKPIRETCREGRDNLPRREERLLVEARMTSNESDRISTRVACHEPAGQ